MTASRYYAVKDTYTLPAQIISGAGGIRFGRGIDMFDPDKPVLVPERTPFFKPSRLLKEADDEKRYEISSDAVKDAFSILRTETVAQEAAVLNTHFRASYGISSIDAAADMAREESRSSVSAYILLSHVGETRSLSDAAMSVNEDLDPLAEHLEDDTTAFTQFRRDFGTHFIETVTYGLNIAIRGRMSTRDTARRQEIAATMSSGFGAVRAGGSVDAAVQKKLHDAGLQINCEINCGGIDPARPLVLQGFDQIAGFLADIAKGAVKFRLAPVALTLFSYWNLLDPGKFPRCRAMLNPHQDVDIYAPSSIFGIPAGTIIAWHPPKEAVRGEGENAEIMPPPGWALCDGTHNTPDLRDRFIRSTSTAAALNRTGGAAAHTHKKTQGDVAKKAGLVTATRKAIIDITEKSDHLPPFITLVHIMKLDGKTWSSRTPLST
ncbi:phage tail protein [Desulfococcus multivorans]|uniref:phage tail protein n=1 Tax=Desulfococcus multivorans TaxID=897 RepID=UPI0008A68A2F|nr:phage tail protein [Desulfococcus multivorans]AOY60385.1 uncharacterized protein Dmul_36160 [Desulfococcus multivorans]